MMLRALRISVWSALALLIAGTVAYGWLQRYDDAVVDVAISNHTDTSQVVRLTDGTSGRRLGTYRVGGRATLRMASYRLDVWYRDPTPSERAADRTDSVGVELLTPDGCRLLDASRLTHGSDVMDIGADDSLYVGDGLATGTGDVVAIDDPCQGEAPVPQGIVANRTRDTIVVGSRLVVGPCATKTLRRGDLAGVPLVAVDLGIRVPVPSMDAQGRRWPLEPRAVVVRSAEVVDTDFAPFIPEDFGSCAGHAPRHAVKLE